MNKKNLKKKKIPRATRSKLEQMDIVGEVEGTSGEQYGRYGVCLFVCLCLQL
jgi:hypothetical protein